MGIPELETRCWTCWGNGVIPVEDHGQMMECPECQGVGWVPTEDGKRLLDFIQRHLGIETHEEEE